MNKMHSIVKLDRNVYSNLSYLDQFIIDKHIDHKQDYTIESIQSDQTIDFLFFEGVPNIGFDSTWFNVIG